MAILGDCSWYERAKRLQVLAWSGTSTNRPSPSGSRAMRYSLPGGSHARSGAIIQFRQSERYPRGDPSRGDGVSHLSEPCPHTATARSRREQARGREEGRRGSCRRLLTLWAHVSAGTEAAAAAESTVGLRAAAMLKEVERWRRQASKQYIGNEGNARYLNYQRYYGPSDR
jgi:hypothetical protein